MEQEKIRESTLILPCTDRDLTRIWAEQEGCKVVDELPTATVFQGEKDRLDAIYTRWSKFKKSQDILKRMGIL